MSVKLVGLGQLGLPLFQVENSGFSRRNDYEDVITSTFYGAEAQSHLGSISKHFEDDERLNILERDGTLVAHGNGASQFTRELFFTWIVYRGNQVGLARALQEAKAYLAATSVQTVSIQYLIGPELDERVEIDDSTSLMPARELEDALERDEFADAEEFRLLSVATPTAALVTKGYVPKIYDESNLSDSSAVRQKMYTLSLLLNALDGVFCFPGYSTERLAPDVPLGMFAGRSGGYTVYDFLPMERCRIDAELVAPRLRKLYHSFQAGSDRFHSRLRIALERLGAAKSKMSDAERALDLGIALEILLLDNDRGDQLRTTAGLRGAWLVGENATSRLRVFKLLREVYDARSSVAHSGELKKNNLSKEHYDLVSAVARAVILSEKLRTQDEWMSIVLGDAVALPDPL